MIRMLLGALAAAFLVVGAVSAEPIEGAPAAPASEPGVEAIYAYAGRYTFRIDARNRYFQNIYQGYATASAYGNSATIRVRCDGYQDATVHVSLRPGQDRYDVGVTMEDPSITVDVLDQDHRFVSAYSKGDNFGTWADRFRFVSRIQAPGFTKFNAQDVEVRVNGLTAFGGDVRVSQGGQPVVEVTLRRRDLRSFSNRIQVFVRSNDSFGGRGEFRQQAFQELHVEPAS